MKKILTSCFALLILHASETYGQKEKETVVENITKVNIFLPGVTHEHKLGRASTIYISAFMNIWVSRTKTFYGGPNGTAHIGPALDISFRNYYNYKRRSRNDRRTEMNSLNYFAPAYTVTAIKNATSNTQLINLVGAVWGMQRNYPSRFSLDLNIGAGYLFNAQGYSNNNSVQPMSQFTLGIWLNKRK